MRGAQQLHRIKKPVDFAAFLFLFSVSFLFQFLFQRIVEHLPRMLCLRNERVNVSEGQTRRPEPFLLDLPVGIHSHLSEAMKNAGSPTW
jgi:hypothetical protein